MQAEQGVLGSLLLDPELCDEVALLLKPADFYSPAHQALFNHLLAMHNDGLRIDATLLHERLKKSGDLEIIGGLAYLAEVADSVPTAANAAYYAEIVRDKATLRSLIHASTEILRDAYDQSLESRELLSRAEERVFRILEDQGAGELAVLQDVLHEALNADRCETGKRGRRGRHADRFHRPGRHDRRHARGRIIDPGGAAQYGQNGLFQ